MQLTAGSLSSRAALRPCGGMRLRPRAVEPSARLGHAAAAAAADVDADGEAEAPGQRKVRACSRRRGGRSAAPSLRVRRLHC
jgi:hypothetical protein